MSFQGYISAVNQLKYHFSAIQSNIYFNARAIEYIISNKKCIFFSCKSGLFLFVPMHEQYHDRRYYDCLYVSGSLKSLQSDLASVLAESHFDRPIRILLMGHGDLMRNDEFISVLEACRFQPGKLLTRLKRETVFENIYKEPHSIQSCAEYAVENDAPEIFEMLNDEFDIYSDNLPEIEEIRRDAEARRIAIIRQNDKIAALRYFQALNGVYIERYDLCRSEYRGSGLFKAIIKLVADEVSRNHAIAKASLWRDLGNPALWALSNRLGEKSEDIFMRSWMRFTCQPTPISIETA